MWLIHTPYWGANISAFPYVQKHRRYLMDHKVGIKSVFYTTLQKMIPVRGTVNRLLTMVSLSLAEIITFVHANIS